MVFLINDAVVMLLLHDMALYVIDAIVMLVAKLKTNFSLPRLYLKTGLFCPRYRISTSFEPSEVSAASNLNFYQSVSGHKACLFMCVSTTPHILVSSMNLLRNAPCHHPCH